MVATIREYLTSIGQAVDSIKTLAEDNGWTIDRHDAGSRCHLHKGTLHFEVYYYDNRKLGIVGCTGYASGSSATAQPGTSAARPGWILNSPINANNEGLSPQVRYVASGNSIYCFFGYAQSTGYGMNTRAMAFGEITDKIGNWVGGQFVCGTYKDTNSYSFDFPLFSNHTATSDVHLAVMLDGAWVNPGSAGTFVGRYLSCPHLRSKMPNIYNAGILPVPLPLFRQNVSDAGLLHPVGFAPGLRVISGGDTYIDGDTIMIGADTYLLVQSRQGASNKYAEYAVKIS